MSSTDLEHLPPDRAISCVTHDGAFRVIALRSTRTVRGIVKSQKAKGRVAEDLGDLATGAILMRLTMAPGYRVQGVIQSAEGTIVGDAWPDGGTRGLLRSTAEHGFSKGSRLHLMRSLPNGTLQQGVVEISNEHRVSGALNTYFAESEQVTSAVGIATVTSGDEVLMAGGYVVQLLPECTEPPLAVLYERLRHDFADLSKNLAEVDNDPDRLAAEILAGMEYTRTLEFDDVDFRCRCSSERVLASLSTVGKKDLEDMLLRAEPLSISCDYCGTEYEIGAERLRGLLSAS